MDNYPANATTRNRDRRQNELRGRITRQIKGVVELANSL
jgi:hypothetical protein